MMDVLAPDVVLLSDGGGKVTAARRPPPAPDDAHGGRADPTLQDGIGSGCVSIGPAP